MRKGIKYAIIFCIIISILVVGLVGCKNTTYKYDNAKKYHVGNGTYDAAQVKAINVAWDDGTVDIVCKDDASNVSVSEENNITDQDWVLHQYVDDKGTLWVKPFASKIDTDKKPTFEVKKLTITMPKILLTSAYVENHGETTIVDGIVVKELETYNTGTSTTVKNARVTEKTKMVAQGITGGCYLSGEISGEITINSALEASLSTTVSPSSINISTKRYARVYLPAELDGYTAVVTSASKFVSDWETSDGSQSEEGTITKIAGNGRVQMNIKCSTEPIGNRNDIWIKKLILDV